MTFLSNSKFFAFFLLCVTIGACGGRSEESRKPDLRLLASDVHVRIADQAITLPWIVLEDYAYAPLSFSLDRDGARLRDSERRAAFRAETSSSTTAPTLDSLNVVVGTYGWNDSYLGQREICAMLTRAWSRSVCDNPWAALKQATPVNRFALVDLASLDPGEHPANCTEESVSRASSIEPGSKAALLCDFDIWGGGDTRYHTAIVRISGNLGAVWAVWEGPRSKETAAEQAYREGEAIVALVRNGLGEREDFTTLHRAVCRLRRPDAAEGPGGRSDCLNTNGR